MTPGVRSCDLAGPILSFLFQLLHSLMSESLEGDATLKRITIMDESTGTSSCISAFHTIGLCCSRSTCVSVFIYFPGLNHLLLMTALPSMSSEALTEGLQFLIGALSLGDKKAPPNTTATTVTAKEESFQPVGLISMALLSMPEEDLRRWLTRVVLGSSSDDSSTKRNSTGLLKKFVEALTKEAG